MQWASDWTPIFPAQQLQQVLGRFESTRGGIVLFHDTKAQTATMLPALLRALRSREYRVVHIVPPASNPLPRTPHEQVRH